MPTICDLKVELKKKGIKGITGLDKAGLQKLLDGGKSIPKKDKKKEEPKKEVKKEVNETKPKPKIRTESYTIRVKKNKKEEKKEEKREKPKPEVKKEKPILLLKFKAPPPPKTKGQPPLANKTLVELYKMRLNLEKTIKDNVNSAEANRSKTILEKVNTAYAYNRKEYMDKINGLNKQKLQDLKEELLEKYDKSKDDDADKIYRGMIGEIQKILV